MRPAGVKPGSVRWRFQKLRSSSAAPIVSTMAIAISATTSPFRSRCAARPPKPPRPDSLTSVFTSVRASRRAGAKPTMRPVATVTPSAKISAVESRPTSDIRGSSLAPTRSISLSPSQARNTPVAAPNVASTRDSINSCWKMRPRPAPSATRTATSFARITPRDSSRLVTLMQATSSSSAEAARMIISVGPSGPTTASISGSILNTRLPFAAGNSFCRARPSGVNAARA